MEVRGDYVITSPNLPQARLWDLPLNEHRYFSKLSERDTKTLASMGATYAARQDCLKASDAIMLEQTCFKCGSTSLEPNQSLFRVGAELCGECGTDVGLADQFYGGYEKGYASWASRPTGDGIALEGHRRGREAAFQIYLSLPLSDAMTLKRFLRWRHRKSQTPLTDNSSSDMSFPA